MGALLAVLSASLPAQSSITIPARAVYASGGGGVCRAGMVSSLSAESNALGLTILAPAGSISRPPTMLARATVPWRAHWRAAGGASLTPVTDACGAGEEQSRGWLAISRHVGSGAVTMGVAAQGIAHFDPTRDRDGIMVGVSRALGRSALSLELRQHRLSREQWRYFRARGDLLGVIDSIANRPPDSVFAPGPSDSASSRSAWVALDVRARWRAALGPLALDMTFGGTHGGYGNVVGAAGGARADSSLASAIDRRNRFRLWGRVEARVRVAHAFEVMGGVVALPAQPGGDAPRRLGLVGVGITGLPRRHRPSVTAGSDGAHGEESNIDRASSLFVSRRTDLATAIVRVRLAHASKVEISSEVTDWQPVTMTLAADGWWEAELRARPGTYRVNVRVDGGLWVAPPGVPSTRDEFGGSVGIVRLN